MKLDKNDIKLLGLSTKEVAVLDALRSGKDTPLLISQEVRVSRPAIYEILVRLKKRGLITSTICNRKKYWSQAPERKLEEELYNTKKQLFNFEEGREELHGLSDSMVVVHRGREAIKNLLRGILKDNKNQRLQGIQGDAVVIGWNKVFGIKGTNELNRLIKKNKIIVEAIVPDGWFERQTKALGKEWAEDFEGRAAITHEISEQYFQHGGQIFIFQKSLYLIAMNEEVIIEVRNSEIQKIILEMFHFIQGHSQKLDANALLRKLIKNS